ncbi:MAG TPA: hypothetical protein PLU50_07250, partial [Pseudobdellovibrionaceae bacterium]|nr:hypothetical protein [Pseudobdellovibrionaceae bacterium]
EKLLRARIVSLSIEEMATVWNPDVYQQFLSAYQVRELKRSQMPPKQMILQYVPPAFAKAFEDLTNARIEKFQSLMFVLENNPEFHQAMNTAKAAWKAHNIHWARAYDPETVALLHYWNVIRLTEDEQIKYLGMTITDNPFSRLAIPVHYETKERWASTLANLESTIESSSIEQLRQTGKLDYASKKLIDQIKYAYPIGGTNGPTWPSFMKTQSWEKLRAANLIKKWPPKPSENE